MFEDVILYSDRRGIRVTGGSITFDNIRYPLANLAYVATRVEQPSRFGPFLVIAVGLSFLAVRIAQRSIGIAILAGIVAGIGVFLLMESKPVYSIDLSVVAGERAPVVRGSKERITAIANAINEAIACRLESEHEAAPFSGDSEISELSVHS
ncbi:MAG TPA: DUF6232 family protein [Candidatus Acidoferrales bacterium]|nr:DUF6232 family protein [Candidatus Acidoferrales bacterium]